MAKIEGNAELLVSQLESLLYMAGECSWLDNFEDLLFKDLPDPVARKVFADALA